MLTRKDFEVLAEYLGKGKAAVVARYDDERNRSGAKRDYQQAIRDVADACKYINGHFDKERFLAAVDGYAQRAKN